MADIWSLGIVLYALTTANVQFFHDNVTALCRQILNCKVHYPMTLNEDLTDLPQRMLCRDPAERITVDTIKEHPYFPAEQYRAMMAQLKMIAGFDFEAEVELDPGLGLVDEEVVCALTAKGIDCSQLAEALATGAKSEAAMLYSVYLRQNHCERMNRVLRSARRTRLGPTSHGSSPALRPIAVPLPILARQVRGPTIRPLQENHQQPHRESALTSRPAARPGVLIKRRRTTLPPRFRLERRTELPDHPDQTP
jgi:hypothetical protein